MPTTYPLPTLAPTIDAAGIQTISYTDIYLSLIQSFKDIYGSDIYIDPDSQDGQWLAVLAKGFYDCNQAAAAAFYAFSPNSAQGAGLSSLVKLNGIVRNVASYSTATGDVAGVVGTTIIGGQVQDVNGNLWDLPTPITIPPSGLLSVLITCQTAGDIVAAAGSINRIANPQLGWQSFITTTAATLGSPVETDAQLRMRQQASVAFPASTIKEAIYAAVGNVAGVTRFVVAENDTGVVSVDGIPAHSIAVTAKGGLPQDIVNAIALRKPPGIQTYGSTTLPVVDSHGLTTNVSFFPMIEVPIYYVVTITKLPNYVDTTGALIRTALVDFTNALDIGEDVYASQIAAAASLIGSPLGQTFYINSIALGIAPAPVGTGNIAVAFNSAATSLEADVGLVVI